MGGAAIHGWWRYPYIIGTFNLTTTIILLLLLLLLLLTPGAAAPN